MQANWSIILNVLLLIGVLVAIGRLMKTRKQSLNHDRYQPLNGSSESNLFDSQGYNDDIIAVRKVSRDLSLDFEVEEEQEPLLSNKPQVKQAQPQLIPQEEPISVKPVRQVYTNYDVPSTIMFFLLAKDNRQFAGYELLQTVLSAGLRFGDGHLFHRHQFANGQGPVLCSLAAATATGVFDLQNIGAFSVRGLCLFMQTSKNPGIDTERFSVMLETARQLSEGLDAHLLDEQRKPLTQERIGYYQHILGVEQGVEESEAV
ncbi:cell division protein ZipA C-terminal FtsZ-binding domain-containing protein [Legionella waltersii]|uniref:Cell division protein ZipA n=1 Tax=Legionella waltersii TaxID=66969 RepID=A0A0W1AD54_9GAMM|nr:cell division protein ZipA C-terminal FtsZ-binding domain-containing protein [Legionella waltersii]KTD79208.1 cell division protein ZipA [Legionella waltersii]SNV12523.1 cell division protein ZipA [Legionella waltersii]